MDTSETVFVLWSYINAYELQIMKGLQSTFLAGKKEQSASGQDCSNTKPNWHLDGLLILDGQLYRPQLSLLGFSGETETAVQQAEETAHDQYHCRHFDCVHFVTLFSKQLVSHLSDNAPERSNRQSGSAWSTNRWV